jgi:chemotaxis protein MotB
MKKFIAISLIVLITGCVSSKKFNELSGNYQQAQKELGLLKDQKQDLTVKNAEIQGKLDQLQKGYQNLTIRFDEVSKQLDLAKSYNQDLSGQIAELEEQLKSLKSGSTKEISALMDKLEQVQNDLQKREEILKKAQDELEQRSIRLEELQTALRQKDEAVRQLRQKVMDALVGFNDKGLTVHEKNGKVYVSLEEKLLFKTGQREVDPKGQQALAKLSDVLAQNPDINIMVEGHTDDVPMRGSGEVKDNWDLSVMRATAVTRILLRNKAIDPKRIIAAGRGEFFPIDDAKTPEARQKNRRTEIILTPRLDEIFKILENN